MLKKINQKLKNLCSYIQKSDFARKPAVESQNKGKNGINWKIKGFF